MCLLSKKNGQNYEMCLFCLFLWKHKMSKHQLCHNAFGQALLVNWNFNSTLGEIHCTQMGYFIPAASLDKTTYWMGHTPLFDHHLDYTCQEIMTKLPGVKKLKEKGKILWWHQNYRPRYKFSCALEQPTVNVNRWRKLPESGYNLAVWKIAVKRYSVRLNLCEAGDKGLCGV